MSSFPKLTTGALIMPAMRIPLQGLEPGDVLPLTVEGNVVKSGKHQWAKKTLLDEINRGLWWYHSSSGVSGTTQNVHKGIVLAVKRLAVEIGKELKAIIEKHAPAEAEENPQNGFGILDEKVQAFAPVDIQDEDEAPKQTSKPFNNFAANMEKIKANPAPEKPARFNNFYQPS